MNEILKKRLKIGAVIQGAAWGLALALIGAMSLVADPGLSQDLETILIVVCFCMFLCPFVGLFLIVPTIQGFWKKISYSIAYLAVLLFASVLGIGLVNISGWETLADRKAGEAIAVEKPKFEAALNTIKIQISALGSSEDANRYVQSYIEKRITNKYVDFPGFDLEYEELGTLVDFLDTKRHLFGDREVAKMYFLLTQVGGDGAEGEDVDDHIDQIFYENPEQTIAGLEEARKELSKGFKEKEMVRNWRNSLGLPQALENEPITVRVKAEIQIKQKLKAIRNASNSEIIDYLLTQNL